MKDQEERVGFDIHPDSEGRPAAGRVWFTRTLEPGLDADETELLWESLESQAVEYAWPRGMYWRTMRRSTDGDALKLTLELCREDEAELVLLVREGVRAIGSDPLAAIEVIAGQGKRDSQASADDEDFMIRAACVVTRAAQQTGELPSDLSVQVYENELDPPGLMLMLY